MPQALWSLFSILIWTTNSQLESLGEDLIPRDARYLSAKELGIIRPTLATAKQMETAAESERALARARAALQSLDYEGATAELEATIDALWSAASDPEDVETLFQAHILMGRSYVERGDALRAKSPFE